MYYLKAQTRAFFTPIKKGRALLLLAIGFIIGIACFSFITLFFSFLAFIFTAIFLVILFIFYSFKAPPLLIMVLLVLLGFSLGAWFYQERNSPPPVHHLSHFNGQTMAFYALVIKVEQRLNGQRLTVKAYMDEQDLVFIGKVLLTTPAYPIYRYGDSLSVICELQAPFSENNYDRYLKKQGIYNVCFRPSITFLSSDNGNFLLNKIFTLKENSFSLVERQVPLPEASLVLPLLFGASYPMEEDLKENFRRAGLSHIVAVSGFHVGLLSAFCLFLLLAFGLSRNTAAFLSIIFLVVYVLMVGVPASALRAGLGGALLLFAMSGGRQIKSLRLITIAAALTLVFNPLLLRDDIGWQLSFSAVLGIVILRPKLESFLLYLSSGRFFYFIKMLSLTLAAQLSTAPISLYNFGAVSLIAPISNLLVVPVVPLLMISTIVALVLIRFMPFLGEIIFAFVWLVARYVLLVADVLSKSDWFIFSK
ncbi:MAG: ComEC/Rec2 family competence protein [Patescibacteria group bacterium]|nr:MAG: ComEC/Rec2 family competence protein [Patescibacteria group bacterium]